MTKSEEKALAPVKQVQAALEGMGEQFSQALPKHIPTQKFINTVLVAVSNSPKLLDKDIDRRSLYLSCMRSAQDGLLPDGREAALVPFKGKVVYIPMVGGIIKKVRNSGELAMLDAQEVFENDEFDAWVDEKGQHFIHRKARKDRGEPILTYAYIVTKDGATYYEEIDEAQMKEIEKMSRAKDGPWKGPFRGEMKRKSAIHRLCKRAPMSSDIESVIRAVEEDFDFTTPVEETPKLENGKTHAAQVITGQDEEPPPADPEEF